MHLSLFGALLLAAPLLSPPTSDPAAPKGQFQWLTLRESRAQLELILGPPKLVAPFGADFLSLQYQIGDVDHHDFTHQVVLRRSDGSLVSITRNYEPEIAIEHFFPPRGTQLYRCAEANNYPVLLRDLKDGRLLLAMGLSHPGQPASQLLLIRESELALFHPWLARERAKR